MLSQCKPYQRQPHVPDKSVRDLPSCLQHPQHRLRDGRKSWGPAFKADLLLQLDLAEEEVDIQVAAALPRTSMPPARPSGDAYSIPSGGPGMGADPGDLTQCEGCGRSFNPKAFEVHSRICAKVFQVSLKHLHNVETPFYCPRCS